MKLIERAASRLLVIAPGGRVLLLYLEPSFRDPFWVTPGGGIDQGETPEEAALRELREEVGRDDLELGPCIWEQRTEFTWERWLVRQEERHFLVRVDATFDAVTLHPDAEPIAGSGWFDAEELDLLHQDVYPDGLAGALRNLVRSGPPEVPIRLPSGRR